MDDAISGTFCSRDPIGFNGIQLTMPFGEWGAFSLFKGIDVRRLRIRVPAPTTLSIAPIIDDEEANVRAFHLRRGDVWERGQCDQIREDQFARVHEVIPDTRLDHRRGT